MMASINRDPKRAFPAKSKLWPIPDIDSLADEVGKQNEDVGRALLDHYKKLGKI